MGFTLVGVVEGIPGVGAMLDVSTEGASICSCEVECVLAGYVVEGIPGVGAMLDVSTEGASICSCGTECVLAGYDVEEVFSPENKFWGGIKSLLIASCFDLIDVLFTLEEYCERLND